MEPDKFVELDPAPFPNKTSKVRDQASLVAALSMTASHKLRLGVLGVHETVGGTNGPFEIELYV